MTDHRLSVHTPACRGVWWSKANFTATKLRAGCFLCAQIRL